MGEGNESRYRGIRRHAAGYLRAAASVFDQIKILGELRVVTRNSPLAFYRGTDDTPEGPEYELARRFADELGVKLKITPVRSYAEIYAALTTGRAHLAAAALKIPAKPIPGVAFGPIYQRVREHLIYRRGAVRPASLAEIGDGDLQIAAGSSHAKALRAARDSIPDLAWIEDATTDSQALLRGVADGDIDYTIADSTEFALAHDEHPDLRIAFDFPGSQSLAWATSTHDPDFLRDVGWYFARMHTDGELAAIVNRYYGRSDDFEFAGAGGFMRHMQSRCLCTKSGSKKRPNRAARTGACWRPLGIRSRNGIRVPRPRRAPKASCN